MISDYIIKIKGYENDLDNDEYEEITVSDFLKREAINEDDADEFIKRYNAINIHNFLSQETLEQTWKLLKNVKTDPRLAKLNAIVMLSLKKQGRARSGFNRVSDEDFKELVFYALENNIGFGFDSCTATKFANTIRDTKYYARAKDMIEPCESTLYSVYINCDAEMFPCSFGEGVGDWKEGLNVLECNNFLRDIWWNEKTLKFKEKCIHCRENNISCPVGYDI